MSCLPATLSSAWREGGKISVVLSATRHSVCIKMQNRCVTGVHYSASQCIIPILQHIQMKHPGCNQVPIIPQSQVLITPKPQVSTTPQPQVITVSWNEFVHRPPSPPRPIHETVVKQLCASSPSTTYCNAVQQPNAGSQPGPWSYDPAYNWETPAFTTPIQSSWDAGGPTGVEVSSRPND